AASPAVPDRVRLRLRRLGSPPDDGRPEAGSPSAPRPPPGGREHPSPTVPPPATAPAVPVGTRAPHAKAPAAPRGVGSPGAVVAEKSVPCVSPVIATAPVIRLPGQSPEAGSPTRTGPVAPLIDSPPAIRVSQIEITAGLVAVTPPEMDAPFEKKCAPGW